MKLLLASATWHSSLKGMRTVSSSHLGLRGNDARLRHFAVGRAYQPPGLLDEMEVGGVIFF